MKQIVTFFNEKVNVAKNQDMVIIQTGDVFDTVYTNTLLLERYGQELAALFQPEELHDVQLQRLSPYAGAQIAACKNTYINY